MSTWACAEVRFPSCSDRCRSGPYVLPGGTFRPAYFSFAYSYASQTSGFNSSNRFSSVSVRSITTLRQQDLFLGADDCALIKGKRILIVDDVISTGESLHALEEPTCACHKR
mgnify:CR=1 FL=1